VLPTLCPTQVGFSLLEAEGLSLIQLMSAHFVSSPVGPTLRSFSEVGNLGGTPRRTSGPKVSHWLWVVLFIICDLEIIICLEIRY